MFQTLKELIWDFSGGVLWKQMECPFYICVAGAAGYLIHIALSKATDWHERKMAGGFGDIGGGDAGDLVNLADQGPELDHDDLLSGGPRQEVPAAALLQPEGAFAQNVNEPLVPLPRN